MEERLLTLGDQMAAGGVGRGQERERESRTEEKIRKKGEDGVKERRAEKFRAGGEGRKGRRGSPRKRNPEEGGRSGRKGGRGERGRGRGLRPKGSSGSPGS